MEFIIEISQPDEVKVSALNVYNVNVIAHFENM